jgi:hypothetical protein
MLAECIGNEVDSTYVDEGVDAFCFVSLVSRRISQVRQSIRTGCAAGMKPKKWTSRIMLTGPDSARWLWLAGFVFFAV